MSTLPPPRRPQAGKKPRAPRARISLEVLEDRYLLTAVTAVTPAAAATFVNPSVYLNVVFDVAMNPATINGGTIELRGPGGALVPGGVTYDPAARTAVFNPTGWLAGATAYSARVKGGSAGVKDAAGNPLAADFNWSFTTRGDAVNPIVAENQLPGNPQSEWDVTGAGDDNIQGFATDISVNKGQTVQFKIKTDSTNYRLDIYRLGYYGGAGARKVATVQRQLSQPQAQPDPLTDLSTGLVDAGNWAVSASWAVPANAVSGIYFAKLVRQDGVAGASHVVFIVRDDDGGSDLLFQTSDTTWQAYNGWGGNSLYYGSAQLTSGSAFQGGRAVKVSYNRPFATRGVAGGLGETNWVFWSEYPMVRWLESNGYNVSYFTNVDSARRGAEIKEHKAFLSVGHDEYWSAEMRANVEAARDAGVNLMFLSGNEVYWKTRWETSTDGSGTPYRTLVCYKESLDDVADPSPAWTGLWRDLRFSPPGDARVEQLLTGQIFSVNRGPAGTFGTAIQVPEADGKMRLWRNTSVAAQQPGGVATLANGTLGYEWDEDVDNGWRPAGTIRLSSTTESVPEKLVDPVSWPGCGGVPGVPCSTCRGCTVAPGQATHSLTTYRATSGALVFGAGTVQWSWGLDGSHDGGATAADVRMQQATVNLLADMGAQPASLRPGLTAAAASADEVAPTSTITSPAGGLVVQTGGSPITITGTAADAGGGLVGGVEVFVGEVVNGREIWHRALGRASWSYTWTPSVAGTITIRSRAADDSSNLEIPSGGVTVTVLADETTPPAVSGVQARVVSNQSVTITWATDEGATSRVLYGTAPGSLTQTVTDSALVTAHAITLTGLTPNTVYYFRVQSTDEYNNTTTVPATGSSPLSFATPAFLDTTAADFTLGSVPANGYLAQTGDGELALAPAAAAEFSGSALPSGWASAPYVSGGAATVSGGQVSVDGARVNTTSFYAAGRSVEFVATFSGAAFQHAGLAVDMNAPPWLVFSTGSAGGALYARSSAGSTTLDTLLPGSWLGAPHRFRIDWDAGTVTYSIDGAVVATHGITVSAVLRPLAADATPGGGALAVDWMRLSPYAGPASFTSRVFDAGGAVNWSTFSWSATTPAGTGLGLSVRMGNTPTPDAGWTDFVPVSAPGAGIGGVSRYLQYKADLATTAAGQTPLLESVAVSHSPAATDTTRPTIIGRTPAPGATNVVPNQPVTVRFSELMNAATFTASSVRLRKVGDGTDVAASLSFTGGTAVLTPSAALVPEAQYQVTVAGTVADTTGNTLGSDSIWTFTTGWLTFADTTVTDFGTGAVQNALVVQTADGEVSLAPTAGAEFTGSALPAGWSSTAWNAGGAAAVAGGLLAVDGAWARTDALFGPGRYLEFTATFSGDPYQHAGLAQDFSSPLWALFSTGGGGALYARSAGPGMIDTLLAGSWLGAPHRFRIDWNPASIDYSIDGTPVASHALAIGSSLRPVASDYSTGGGNLTVDWMRLSPYTAAGNFTSRVFDAGGAVAWNNASWSDSTPSGTSLGLSVRLGNTPTPDASWTDFIPLASSGTNVGGTSRYLQYKADLATTNPGQTPVLQDVMVRYTAALPDTTAPHVLGRAPAPGTADVDFQPAVTVQFSELMTASTITTATFRLRAVGAPSDVPAAVTYSGSTATLTPTTALAPNTTYQVTVAGTIRDAAGNALGADDTWTFTTRWLTVGDTAAADFGAGTAAGAYVSQTGDGEVTLAPAAGAEFSGTALPAGWFSSAWNAGGGATVAGGAVTVDGAQAGTTALYGPGRALEFVATFGGAAFQHAGFAVDFSSAVWAMFSTAGGGALYARTSGTDTLLPGSWLGAPHRFRIDWGAGAVTYSIDGAVVATHNVAVTSSMRPVISDYNTGGGAVVVDWMRLSPYAASGSFTSRVFDAGAPATWDAATWTAATPAGTSVALSVRVGNTPAPDATWTDFAPLASSGAVVGSRARYLQYRADLATTAPDQTPVLQDVAIRYSTTQPDTVAPAVVSRSPAPGATGVDLLAPVVVRFSDLMSAASFTPATFRLRATGSPTDVAATLTVTGSTATLRPNVALAGNTTYQVTVAGTVTDASGNPLGSDGLWTFTTGAGQWLQTTAADFGAGTVTGVTVTSTSGGELQLAASFRDDFDGAALGSAWTTASWAPAGGGPESITVSGGTLSLAGTMVRSVQTFTNSPVEGRVAFGAAPFQHFGMATDLSALAGNYWAIFSTGGTSDRLFARVNVSGTTQEVDLGALPAGFHLYRITPVAGGFQFYVDDVLRTTVSATFPAGTPLRIAFSAFNGPPSAALQADWARIVGYAPSGTFLSAVFDATRAATWGTASWTAALPSGTSIVVETRSGSTATPDAGWSAWAPVTSGAAVSSPSARYLQYRVTLVTSDPLATPTLFDISFLWS